MTRTASGGSPSGFAGRRPLAERGVIGACLVPDDDTAVETALSILGPADFQDPRLRATFVAIRSLWGRHEAVDIVSVGTELDRTGHLSEIGGREFLTSLADDVPTIANASTHARQVKRASLARDMVAGHAEAIRRIQEGDADPESRLGDRPVPLDHAAELPSFPIETLPELGRALVAEVSRAYETPRDLAGMLFLSAVSAAASGRVKISPRPGWEETVNLYTATAMEPGERKSAVFSAILSPLERLARELVREAAPRVLELTIRRKIAEERAREARKRAVKAKSHELPDFEREVIELEAAAAAIEPLAYPRILASDATPEAVTLLLAEQDGRLAILSPEGEIFDLMVRYNRDGRQNFDVYLKAHCGDPIQRDRASGSHAFVEEPILTMGLTVQPDVIRLIADIPGFRGRGLLARLLYSFPVTEVGDRECGKAAACTTVLLRYDELVGRILRFCRPLESAVMLTLSPEAERLLLAFEREIEPRLHRKTGDLAHLAGWAEKLAGATTRISALLHLTRHPELDAQVVPEETVASAIQIARYLIPHALHAFGHMGADRRLDGAKRVVAWIVRDDVREFSEKQCFDKVSRSAFPNMDALRPALHLLVEYGWLFPVNPPSGPRGRGRPPAAQFRVHPLAAETAKAAKTPPGQSSADSAVSAARDRADEQDGEVMG